MPDDPTPDQAADDADDSIAVEKKASAPRRTSSEAPAARSGGTGKAVALTVLITLLAVATAVSGFLAVRYHGQATAAERAASDRAHAEDIAGKYGVGAATVDFNDVAPWLQAMKTGVTDTMAKRYDAIAETMRQVVVPLRLQSKGTLVVAKVVGETDGVYKVATVVDMSSTSVQAPQGTVTTTAYTVTVDRNQNWLITDMGNPASDTPLPIGSPTQGSAAPSPSPTPGTGTP